MHWFSDALLAMAAIPAYFGGIWLMRLCAALAATCLISSLVMVGTGWNTRDRLAMLGLAVSILVSVTPFDFAEAARGLAYLFLTALIMSRFGEPAFKVWQTRQGSKHT